MSDKVIDSNTIPSGRWLNAGGDTGGYLYNYRAALNAEEPGHMLTVFRRSPILPGPCAGVPESV